MKFDKIHVDIILPPDFKGASASDLKMCELFIGRLLQAKGDVTNIRVDTRTKSVLCTDNGVREVLRLFLGAGNFESFLTVMISLLHPSNDRSLGILICKDGGVLRKFSLVAESFQNSKGEHTRVFNWIRKVPLSS